MSLNTITYHSTHMEVIIHKNGTQIGSFLCDFQDEDVVNRCNWRLNTGGYVEGYLDGKTKLFHRIICPTELKTSVDHINRVRTDNRRFNLRPSSARMQTINRDTKIDKKFPPGITLTKNGAGFMVSFSDDRYGTNSYYISVSKYGYSGALKLAMDARMNFICSNQDYAESLFQIDALSKILDEYNGPRIETIADIIPSLQMLLCLGFNMWSVVYDGKYNQLYQQDMSEVDKMLLAVRKVVNTLTGSELSEFCRRTLNLVGEYIILETPSTTGDIIKKKIALGDDPTYLIAPIIEEVMGKMESGIQTGGALIDTLTAEKDEESLNVLLSEFDSKIREIADQGKDSEAKKSLGVQIRKLDRIVNPHHVTTVKRIPKLSQVVRNWAEDNIYPHVDSVVTSERMYKAYIEYCLDLEIKYISRQNFNATLVELGYTKGQKVIWNDVEMY